MHSGYGCQLADALSTMHRLSSKKLRNLLPGSIADVAAESYCAEAAKKPLYASKMREEAKVTKYLQAYKNMDDIHFEPFVVKSVEENLEKELKKYSRRSAILSPKQRTKVDHP